MADLNNFYRNSLAGIAAQMIERTEQIMNTANFTASNGDTIETRPDGWLVVRDGHHTEWVGPRTVETLREYFQHRRDAELGRWRDPEDLDVYIPHRSLGTRPGRGERRWVTVHDERLNTSVEIAEDYDRAGMGSRWDTAKRYFAAHPEPKTWQDAKPGEVWLLTINGDEGPAVVCLTTPSGGYAFIMPNLQHVGIESDEITAGRKIWPEESDDE